MPASAMLSGPRRCLGELLGRADARSSARAGAACCALALIAVLSVPSAQAAAPPQITGTAFHVAGADVRLEAMVDPGERKTTYHFEYVDQAGFEASGFAGATSVPVPDGEIPAAVTGTGDLTKNSSTIENVSATGGTFAAGQILKAPGLPAAGTKIKAVEVVGGSETLVLADPATATAPSVALKAEGPQPVAATIGPLPASTTYHFRLLAHNNQATEPTVGPDVAFTTPVPAPVFGPCPNDAFRTGHPAAALPDCRAYEQVSPVDKNGADAEGTPSFVKAAPGGEAISFFSTTGFPGGVGSQEVPLYRAQREAGGWSTAGLLAPAEFGQLGKVVGWLPDLSTAYDLASRLDIGSATLLAHPAAGGPLTEIAPYTPNAAGGDGQLYSFAGATPTGSEVVFESRAALPTVEGAPLDHAPNLYVWDRDSQALRLAGVLNDGEAPKEGAIGGSYDWARGTSPTTLAKGGARSLYFTQDEHAVATDGTVFFTAAGSGTLYERVNPTAPQSAVVHAGEADEECTEAARACTVQVSATEKTNGKGPGGSDAAGARPAAFMAATPDGSKAFFTSSEKLTDDANTGPEPELPAIARSDLEGNGKDLTFIPARAKGIAVGGEYVYWADPEGHAIGRARLDGTGEPEDRFIVPGPTEFETHPRLEPGVLHSAPAEPQYVAVDANHIYWTNTGPRGDENRGVLLNSPYKGAGTIGRAALDGAGNLVPGSVEAAFITGASNPQGIAVDSEHVYWGNSEAGGELNGRFDWEGVGRAELDGNGVDQFWSKVGWNVTGGLAVDANHVYLATFHLGEIRDDAFIERLSKTNPDAEFGTVVYRENQPAEFRGLAIQGTKLFWSNSLRDRIGRIDLATWTHFDASGEAEEDAAEAAEELVAPPAGHPLGLATDSAHLYWAADQGARPNSGNDLYRYSAAPDADGHHLADLSADPGEENGAEVKGVLGIGADGSDVYFAANGVLAANEGALGTHAAAGTCNGTIGSMSGTCNLYLWREGSGGEPAKTEFIAALDAGGGSFKTDALDWAPTPFELFGLGSASERTAWASPDGRVLVFRSQQQLTPYENHGIPEFYRYDAEHPGALECLTCNPTGEDPRGPAPAGGPGLSSVRPTESSPIDEAQLTSRYLAGQGSRFFFETAEALVAADSDGEAGCPIVGSASSGAPACNDVYEWEAPGAGSCSEAAPPYSPANGGCLYLLSPGQDSTPSFFADASESGDDAFFFTRTPLVGADADEQVDVYDARVGGGLAAQNQPPAPGCESSEACKPAAAAPPAFPAPPHFQGPGNPPPPKRCKPGTRRKGARCVKKRHAKHHKRHPKHHHRGAGR